MGEWKEIQLGKLGKTFTGLSGKTKDDFGFGKPYIPYLNVFQNNKIKPTQLDLVDIKPDEKQNLVKYGDLLFTTSSETIEEVGMTSVILHDLGEVYLNSFCFGFRLNDFDNLLPEYVPFLFRSDEIRHKISLQGQGSTRYNLSKTELLKKLILNLPSLPEQTRIAEILSTADEAISHTEALIAKYQRIKTGLMQDLLTKGVDENGNIRSKTTHKFVVKNGVEVPEEWEVIKLIDCVDKSTIITYGIVQTGLHVVDGVRVLRTVDLQKDKIESSNLLRTTEEISNSYKRTILKKFDLVCNVRASVGDFNIIDNDDLVGCNTTRGVARISPKKEINPYYLLWFLRSERNTKQMELLIKGTTFIDINIADLREIWIPIPNERSEQDKIADKLIQITYTLQDYHRQLLKLQSLKTGLMQDLLSGKVRVKIKEEEIA